MARPTGNGVFGPVAGQPNPSADQPQSVQDIIAEVAREKGVPVELALAIAQVESNFNPKAVGDGGHSVGLFQLNDRGEGAGMSVADREDARRNAEIALTQVANVLRDNPGMDWGSVAAAAQRPLDRAGYANKVNGILKNGVSVPAASGGGTFTSSSPLSGQDLIDYAEQNFPQYAYLLHDPEVGPILVKAAQENVSDPNILAGMLRNTNWWNRTSSTARGFNQLLADDPATANQAIQNQMAQIDAQAWGMGVKLTPQIEHDLAVNSLKLGWTQDTLQQQIAAANKTTYTATGQFGGQAALDVQQLKAMYSAYALPIDDKTLNNQVQLALSGKSSIDALKQQVAQQAANFYAANQPLSQFLEGGKGTVQDWAAPLVNQAANILGVDANSINLMSPQWSFLLQPQTNPTTGQPTGMAQTLDSVQRKIQTDPVYGYSKTANGVAQYQALAQKLVASFGGGLVSG